MCYNQADFVYEALESVKLQDYKNTELIIVDDCSTDSSVQVIKNWNKNFNCTFIENKSNLGNTKSFNKAYKKSTGDFIIDLAADDVLEPNFISEHLKTFENSKYSNLGVVYSNVETIKADGSHIKFHYQIDRTGNAVKKPPTGNIYRDLLFKYFINSPSMMAKRTVYDFLNGYDERLAYEDLDFWIRSSRVFDYDYTDAVLIKREYSRTLMVKNSIRTEGKRFQNLH